MNISHAPTSASCTAQTVQPARISPRSLTTSRHMRPLAISAIASAASSVTGPVQNQSAAATIAGMSAYPARSSTRHRQAPRAASACNPPRHEMTAAPVSPSSQKCVAKATPTRVCIVRIASRVLQNGQIASRMTPAKTLIVSASRARETTGIRTSVGHRGRRASGRHRGDVRQTGHADDACRGGSSVPRPAGRSAAAATRGRRAGVARRGRQTAHEGIRGYEIALSVSFAGSLRIVRRQAPRWHASTPPPPAALGAGLREVWRSHGDSRAFPARSGLIPEGTAWMDGDDLPLCGVQA